MTMAQELHERGFNDGRTAGFNDGRNEGRAAVLTRLLRLKFGETALTATIEGRLHAATTDQLDYWCERILDAQKIDDVFSI